MPRRRGIGIPGAGRRRNPVKPPTPIKVKPIVIDLDGLAGAYGWLTVNRIGALTRALAWYNDNVPKFLVGNPLTADQQKQYDKARKAQLLGEGAPGEHEKEAAMSMAIRIFEKIWAGRKLPKLDEVAAGGEVPRNVALAQRALEALRSAYKKYPVQFEVSFGTEREADGTQILIPENLLAEAGAKAPLETVLSEAPTVAKLMSISITPDGPELDVGKMLGLFTEVLTEVSVWAKGRDRGDLLGEKRAPKVRKARVRGEAGPKAPRPSRNGVIKVIKTGPNPFRGRRAKFHDLVIANDGNTVKEFMAACLAAGLKATTKPVQRGVQFGFIEVV